MSYSPETGRWLEQDPAGYADGSDLYLALRDNPLRFTDPLGLCGSDGRGSSNGPPATQPTTRPAPADVLQKIFDNPALKAKMDQAWKDSNPDRDDGDPDKVEHGFLIYRNPKTGQYETQDLEPSEERDGMRIPKKRKSIPIDFGLIASFHTHPFIHLDPRPSDIDNKHGRVVPGIIRCHDGWEVFGAGGAKR